MKNICIKQSRSKSIGILLDTTTKNITPIVITMILPTIGQDEVLTEDFEIGNV